MADLMDGFNTMSNWMPSPGYQDTGVGNLPFMSQVNTTGPGSLWNQFQSQFSNTPWLDGVDKATGAKTQGILGAGLGVANSLLGGYLGLQQLGVAKDTLAQNKAQFAQNFAAQAKTTNAALSDRQAARVASNPGAYQSVGDYMKTYGIGG